MPEPVRRPMPWWNGAQLSPDALKDYGPCASMLFDHAASFGEHIETTVCHGVLLETNDNGKKELLDYLLYRVDVRQPLHTSRPLLENGTEHHLIVWNEGCLTLDLKTDHTVTIQITTTRRETIDLIASELEDHIVPGIVRQPIYAIAEEGGQTVLAEIGLVGQELIEDNYEESVVDDFYEIVEELRSESPRGRLVILQGEPGTGKTHFVCGIIEAVLDAMFIFVPSHVVEDLAGPRLIMTLVRARSQRGIDKPIILVIEDADLCLVPRDHEAGSMSAISALLNMSDGIIGRALNLRVVCTTNAFVEDIDPAIDRPMRLLKRLDIASLSPERATARLQQLVEGCEIEFLRPISLAKVYFYARGEDIDEEDLTEPEEEPEESAEEEESEEEADETEE